MRDIDTLMAEARALATVEERQEWIKSLTSEETTLFFESLHLMVKKVHEAILAFCAAIKPAIDAFVKMAEEAGLLKEMTDELFDK